MFEINDKLFIRKGELSQEIIDEAKERLISDGKKLVIQKRFEVGDVVNHKIWKKGRIVEVNEEKGEYQVEFLDTNRADNYIYDTTITLKCY